MNPRTLIGIVSLVIVAVLVDVTLHAIGSQYSITGAGIPESMFQLIRGTG